LRCVALRCVPCCVALRCVALRCVVLCCVVLCCVVLCCVVLCCVVLCCVVLCCVVLCYLTHICVGWIVLANKNAKTNQTVMEVWDLFQGPCGRKVNSFGAEDIKMGVENMYVYGGIVFVAER